MNIRSPHTIALCALAVACNAAVDEHTRASTSAAPPTAAEPVAPAASSKPVVAGLPAPLQADVTGLALVDRVDVANEASERAHDYAVQDPTFIGTHEFDVATANVAYAEDGRAMKTSEAFNIKVVPRQENLLVRAFDTLAKDQKVRVVVDGQVAGDWALPDNESNRYGEAVFKLTPAMVGDRTNLDIKLQYISGVPDTNSFVYWVYAKPDRALESPVSTKLSGLTLTDRVDVANEDDEAKHEYVIDKSTYVGTQQLEWPGNALPFFENGRANKSFESFQLKVTPNKDHVLVKAYDTLSKNQVVRVLVNGAAVGDWTLPDGEARYGESSFRIPARFIGAQKAVIVRVELVSGTDTNSFYYWLFADAGARSGAPAPSAPKTQPS
ncbi:MAG TPA: hypothetical protein VMG12_00465 [Polyangiaceae bacterium]|nr:hypothetical protein [Polyangiaceae bacterium]